MLLRGPNAATIEAIISIRGAREPALESSQVQRQLTLHFDDIEVIDPADPEGRHRAWAMQKWNEQIGRPMSPPTVDDAKKIIEFADSIRDVKGLVLCQCHGGISRSPAAALLCLATWTGKGNEQYCVNTLRQAALAAMPHRGLIAFGDQVLDRNGALVSALNS